MLDFALNQVTMAHAPMRDFLQTARNLDCIGVELRNDLDRPTFDGIPARYAGEMVRDHGLRFLGMSQVYPCNRWSETIATESQTLIDSAVDAGAETISLIPCNDGTGTDTATRIDAMTYGLEKILPLLQDAKMTALFEPLGFERSSMRMKSEAIAVIQSLDAGEHVKIVHDTFHHTLADGGEFYPEQTGIVHVSGVKEPSVAISDMADAHRVLVDANDRLGNVEQIQALVDAGYTGAFSFECFASEVHALRDPEGALKQSMDFIATTVRGFHSHTAAAEAV